MSASDRSARIAICWARRITNVIAGLLALTCAGLFAALHVSLWFWTQIGALVFVGLVLISWGLGGDDRDGKRNRK
jgi:hypothetical protein